jgi:predicted DNA-binding protein
MHRTQVYIPERDIKRLREISKETGKSIGELVRRLIDEYLEKVDKGWTREKSKDFPQ